MEKIMAELAKLEEMQQTVDKRRKELRADAIREAQEIIDPFELVSSDFRFGDVDSIRKAKRAAAQPKYVGPQGELWTGRGRRPKWVEDILAAKGNLDDYLINKD